MSTAFKQLCQLCSPNTTLNTIKQESLDWQAIWGMALRHRVVPVMADRIKQLGILAPTDIDKRIKNHCHNNLIKGMKQATEIIRLTKLFKENNIHFVIFKGIALIKVMEIELYQRHHGDIDILLADVNDLWAVDELLVNIGYKRDSPSKKLNLNAAQKKYFLENRKDLTYVDPNQQIKLEIHFKLLNSICLPSLTPKNILKNKSNIKLANETIPVMNKTAYPIYLLLHGAASQWFRLKWLLDLSMVSHNGKNYLNSDFLKKTQQLNVQRAAYQGIYLSHNRFQMPISDKVQQTYKLDKALQLIVKHAKYAQLDLKPCLQLSSHRNNLIHTAKGVINRFIYEWNLTDNYSLRIRQIKTVMTSPKDWIFFPLPLSLFWAYYPLRPIFWFLRRHTQKTTSSRH